MTASNKTAEYDLSAHLDLIRRLVFFLRNLDNLERELLEFTQHSSESIKSWCFSPVPPGFWYELTFVEHLNLYVTIAGLSEHIKKMVDDGSLFTGKEELLEVEQPGWIEKSPDVLRRSIFFSALYALIKTMQAIKKVSQPINELIAEGANGNLDSLRLAVKLDPAALGSPSVSSMIVYHEYKGKNKLKTYLYNALKNPRNITPLDHPLLRFVLRFMYEDGILKLLTEEDRYEFFCVELELYPLNRSDPAGSLNRWIRRWQEHYVRTRHDQDVSSPFRNYVINFLDLIQNQEVENDITRKQTDTEKSV